MKSKWTRIRNRYPVDIQEQGSVLVVTLITITVLTIIGMVLLQVVQHGKVQSFGSEGRIMAETLAQKGLDEAQAVVRAAVGESNSNQMHYNDRINAIQQALTHAQASLIGSYVSPDGRGGYDISIVDEVMADPTGQPMMVPDHPYSRKWVVTVTGSVTKGRQIKATKTMTLYVSTINPMFRYAISAGSNTSGGEAALQLNGTPFIVGDAYIGGDMAIQDKAYYLKGPDVIDYVATHVPTMRGFYKVIGQVNSESNELFSETSIPFEDSTLQEIEPIDVDSLVQETINQVYRHAGIQSEWPQEVGSELIWTGNTVGWKHYMNTWISVSSGTTVTLTPPPGLSSSDILIEDGLLDLEDDAELIVENGSLFAIHDDPDLVVVNLSGSLQLNPHKVFGVKGNVVMNDGFRLNGGTVFVDGHLKIYGDVYFDGAVYVNGNVELRDINSINACEESEDESEGERSCSSLIVVSSGEINVGEYENESNTSLNAFLFAKRKLHLYGVLSKLEITGGVHGEEGVELNAVRGELELIPGAQETDPEWMKKRVPINQMSIEESESRLKIIHDSQLYDYPPPGIPTTDLNVYIKEID